MAKSPIDAAFDSVSAAPTISPPLSDGTKLPFPAAGNVPSSLPTGTIGKYKLLAELGEGGMGRVYKAHDPELNRPVAIKVLKAGTGTDDVVRFRGEAAMVAAVEHPNIVQVYDIATDSVERPYIVLEYVDGGNLADQLKERLPKPREAAEKIETLARAVHAAHQKGIIHRDLKPHNVLVTAAGTLKVSDFGLGKRLDDTSGKTRTGDVFGTPGYMAPEQARGDKQIGPPTDVYALGAILYQMLTGRPPFTGAKVWEVLSQVQYADPVSPSLLAPRLPKDLCTVCLKCLEKPPAKRYATAEALADDVRRYLDGQPVQAMPVPWFGKVWRQVRRRPREAGVAALVLAGGVGLGFAGLAYWNETKERRAERQRLELINDHQEKEKLQQIEAKLRLEKQYEKSLATMGEVRKKLLDGKLDDADKQALFEIMAGYFEQVQADNESAGVVSLAKLAADTTELADLYGRTSDKAKAVRTYRKAADLYRKATAEEGADAAKLTAAAARADRFAGKYLLAQRKYADARPILEAAEVAFRDLPDCYADHGEALHLLGELAGGLERYDDAVRYFQQSIAERERVREADAAGNPTRGRRRDLALGHGYLGDVYLNRQQYALADRHYWASIRHRQGVVEKPAAGKFAVPMAQHQLARGWVNLVELYGRQRAFDTATYFLEMAKPLIKSARDSHPEETEIQSDEAYHLRLRADLALRECGGTDPGEAKRKDIGAALDAAGTAYESLRERSRTDSGPRSGLIATHALRARLHVLAQKGADDPARRAADLFAEAEYAGNPTSRSPADVYHYAAVRTILGDPDGGLRWLRTAVESRQYRDRHPDDIRNDPAFRSVRELTAFKDVVAMLDGE